MSIVCCFRWCDTKLYNTSRILLCQAVKIFRFYRDLIKFREKGDPAKLLKFVNPKEAKLIDAAAGIHVRFRLGGVCGMELISYSTACITYSTPSI
jgi:hypothetical protein